MAKVIEDEGREVVTGTPQVVSFLAKSAGSGFTLPPALLAAVLLRRQREPLTYVSQEELDKVKDDEFQVTDHKNGHFTVRILPRKDVRIKHGVASKARKVED